MVPTNRLVKLNVFKTDKFCTIASQGCVLLVVPRSMLLIHLPLPSLGERLDLYIMGPQDWLLSLFFCLFKPHKERLMAKGLRPWKERGWELATLVVMWPCAYLTLCRLWTRAGPCSCCMPSRAPPDSACCTSTCSTTQTPSYLSSIPSALCKKTAPRRTSSPSFW